MANGVSAFSNPAGSTAFKSTFADNDPAHTQHHNDLAATQAEIAGTLGRSWLTRSGTTLLQGSARYTATGYNCYVMRSAGGTVAQTMTDAQRDQFFASLRPHSLVRVWAFSPANGTYTNAQVFAEQDKIVASAKAYGHRLIFTLADWAGNANDGTGAKTAAWLTGTTYTGAYQTWLDLVVQRYAQEPTVAIWDLMNEPLVPSNSADLLTFVNAMGARVKQWAPNALVMLGINTPALSCGSTANYQAVAGSAFLDIVSCHDYFEVPGLNDLIPAVVGVARAVVKPMLVDEMGIWAASAYGVPGNSPGGYAPVSYEAQAQIVEEKARLYAGYPEIAGWLLWSEMEAGYTVPGYEPLPFSRTRRTVSEFDIQNRRSFTPETVAGLEAWFKAVDTWRVAEGSTSSTIYRRGTANNYATTWTAVRAVQNGKPAWLNANASATFTDLSAVEVTQTWFVVCQPTLIQAGVRHYLFGADNGSGGLAAYIDGTTGKVNLLNEGSAPFGVGNAVLTAWSTYLIEIHFTKATGTWSIWINGVQDASGAGATTGTFVASSNTSLGRQFTWQPGGAFTGYFFEILKYNTDVSAADAMLVRGYLLPEYGANRTGQSVAAPAQQQVFTASGTWVKPAGAKIVQALVIAGGGGGGSGARGAVGTVRTGGAGGGAGGTTTVVLDATLLGANEAVTVGSGGSAGAAIGTDSTVGATGGQGGSSRFAGITANGGFGGGGGLNAATAATGGGGGGALINGASGANSSSSGGNGSTGSYSHTGSGGAGGGISSGDGAAVGGGGGQSYVANGSGGTGGTTGSLNGGAGVPAVTSVPHAPYLGGSGGGGGAAATTSAAGTGGAGGAYGAGGGGGGASVNAQASGAGGVGGAGVVVVTTYF